MTYGLTHDQRDAMRVIQELIDGGLPCRFRDIKREMCMSSTSQTHWLVHALIERGYLAQVGAGSHSRLTILQRVEMPEECRVAPVMAWPAWMLDSDDKSPAPNVGEVA